MLFFIFKFIKIVIGSVVDNEVVVLYRQKTPISHVIENGRIIDKETLVDALCKLNPVLSEEYHINQLLDNVVLVLPPFGFEAYNVTQLTSVLSEDQVVGYSEIRNLINLIRNKRLPVDNEIINVIFESFKTQDEKRYSKLPVGQISATVTGSGKVLTLPKKINEDFSEALMNAGIKCKQKAISSFASVELIKTQNDIPDDFLLVDIGAYSTQVSLVGRRELVGTRSFSFGGDYITERIIEKFNINEAQAIKIKTLYGLDYRKMSFKYPLCESVTAEGKKQYFTEDLNATLEEECDKCVNLLKSTIEQLALTFEVPEYQSLPIILIGGCSLLPGLVDYLKNKLGNENISTLIPTCMGARDPSLFSALGAILVKEKYLSEFDSTSPVGIRVTRDN